MGRCIGTGFISFFNLQNLHVDHQLNTKDLQTVFRELYDARTKWNSIGLELGMSYSDLQAIKQRNRDDPDECFKDLLSRWLNQVNPKPTWEALVGTLESQVVGHEQLAETVRGRYCCIPLDTTSSTINGHGHQATCNDSFFHCPCGECDLISYLDDGCPKVASKQYPYLELSALDEDDKIFIKSYPRIQQLSSRVLLTYYLPPVSH